MKFKPEQKDAKQQNKATAIYFTFQIDRHFLSLTNFRSKLKCYCPRQNG